MEENLNKGSSAGPVIATVVVLAVIILGGLYFWNERNKTDNGTDTAEMTETSDESTQIEADLDTIDYDSIDAELNAS